MLFPRTNVGNTLSFLMCVLIWCFDNFLQKLLGFSLVAFTYVSLSTTIKGITKQDSISVLFLVFSLLIDWPEYFMFWYTDSFIAVSWKSCIFRLPLCKKTGSEFLSGKKAIFIPYSYTKYSLNTYLQIHTHKENFTHMEKNINSALLLILLALCTH